MSKFTLVRELQKELNRLNTEIDLRIIHGQTYKSLTQRHRFIVNQLADLRREPMRSPRWMTIFTKLGRAMSMFLF